MDSRFLWKRGQHGLQVRCPRFRKELEQFGFIRPSAAVGTKTQGITNHSSSTNVSSVTVEPCNCFTRARGFFAP